MSFVGKKIQITSANFGNIVRKGCLLVDKSLMIKDFIEGEEVSLITRPRRFGKTLNLSMLHHFFAAEVDEQPTKDLFNKFAITKEVDEEGIRYIERYQGQYPVIFITFKDVKAPNFHEAIEKMTLLMANLYDAHRHCLHSEELSEANKINFSTYLHAKASKTELEEALSCLSKLLYRVHKKRVIILIDEYDSPLTSAYEHGYLEELSDFMRNIFSAALKDNDYLEKGLMTGILRVSQSSMLSGLNNLEVYTVLNQEYEQYFGFTEEEVSELIAHLGITESLESIRNFYNGYQVGHTVIYNPWSLMSYLKHQRLQPYWVLTSHDNLLKELLLNSPDDVKENLSHLIAGHAIETSININLRYNELIEDPSTLWTLLLFCGYLTVKSSRLQGNSLVYELNVPNREVMIQYETVFTAWLEQTIGANHYVAFLNDLLEGRIAVFIQKLTRYLLSCTSTHDFYHESNYHTFVLGLIASVTATHHVSSNKEAGLGRPDLVLIPKDTERKQGFILEFKHVDYKKQPRNSRLELDVLLKGGHKAVLEALHQINTRAYEACFLPYPHIIAVVKIGIAFANRLVSAGSITTLINQLMDPSPALNEQAITFYDEHDDHDEN